jgi:hypothetical protein
MLELKKKDSLQRERCILIGIINKDQDEEKSMEYLEELGSLRIRPGRIRCTFLPRNYLVRILELS